MWSKDNVGAATEAILIQTWRALLFWGWNARCHCKAWSLSDRSVAGDGSMVRSRGRNLQVLRSIVIGPTEARHTQVGERPKQEKGCQSLTPKRTVPRTPHLNGL